MAIDQPRSVLERIPPQNLEAEQAALGAMLLERDAILRAEEALRPELFYREAHQQICRGIFDLYHHAQPVDLITLGEWLQQRELLEVVGGTHYLTTLIAMTPTASGIGYYCDIIREKARRRALIRMADRLMTESYTAEDGADLIARYGQELDRIGEEATDVELRQLWQWEEAVYRQYAEENERGEVAGVTTSFKKLNNILDPMQPGEMVIIAGRPSMGKSVLAMQMALDAAKMGKHVLVFSVEMDEASLARRALVADSESVKAWQLKMLNYRKHHWPEISEELTDTIDRHAAIDLTVINPRGHSPADVLRLGRRRKHEAGLDLVIIDYIQLMHSTEERRERYDDVSALSRELKGVATALKVPVVAVSQLSRAAESRPDKRPMLSDLRESGQLEQDADAVLLLYRAGYYNLGDPNRTEVIIAKQRNGKTGTANLYFDMERSRFADLDEEE